MVALFQRYDFTALHPAERCSSSGYRLTGLGIDLYLLPKENYAMHTSLLQEEDDEVRVTWFNPFTVAYVAQEPTTPQPWCEFRSPWPGQLSVLILDAAS